MKCPNCGNELEWDGYDHYVYCIKIGNEGCNTLWATTENCYFTQLYVIDEMGVKAYIQSAYEGGKTVKTDKILEKYKPRGLP